MFCHGPDDEGEERQPISIIIERKTWEHEMRQDNWQPNPTDIITKKNVLHIHYGLRTTTKMMRKN